MKRLFVLLLAGLSLLFACTPENNSLDNNNGETHNNPNELTITGDAFDITDNSAALTGYANLPFEFLKAEVGIMYDKQQSFEGAEKVEATELDGNNKFTVIATGLEPSTTYYFKSYVQNGTAVEYGSVKYFMTQVQKVRSITIDRKSLSLVMGEEYTLSVTNILPDNANDKTYTWSSSNSAIASVDNSGKVTAKAEGSATIRATANDGGGAFASCSVEVYRIDVPQAVDMGIVVNGKNIMWASFNIGASSPEEYGLYYAWGETEPKKDYSWETYKFGIIYYGNPSKYNDDDYKTILDPEDDVAHVKLGGEWHIPTYEEWAELRNKCTWTFTTQNEVKGVKVTASNGNSIFLPAASHIYYGSWDGINFQDDGRHDYWSSSLSLRRSDCAQMFCSNSGYVLWNQTERCQGLPVRPVYGERPFIKVRHITLDKKFLLLLIGEESTLSVTSILPDNATDKSYTWSSSDSAIASVDNSGKVTAKAIGEATIKATANDGTGVFASCKVDVRKPYTAVAGDAVDLGLSVKWSPTNLGATSPTGYGDYFAWGETSPKSYYYLDESYKWYNGSSGTYTKYNTADNKTVLDPEDDVAHVTLGGEWHIPTYEEWIELRTKCTWTWKTNYNGSGINGRLVTATNGNSIFLPAAGYRYDANHYSACSDGYYWSSSLLTDDPDDPNYAWYVYFDFGGVSWGGGDRYYGRSVRPVWEE